MSELENILDRRKLSIHAFAKRCGFSRTSVYRWLEGQMMSITSLARIVEELDLNKAELRRLIKEMIDDNDD